MDLLQYCVSPPIVIVANHDRINEKSKEHSLEFIRYQARLITEPTYIENIGYILPYYHDPQELRSYLKTLPPKSTIIMHQGLIGSNQGDYIQDKSAITKDDVAGFRVISGHYHQRQTIDLPDGGKWDYIGNPYSLNYGEANDPPKGFQILMDDGSLEFVPTNLRKHIVIDNYISEMVAIPYIHEAGDLVWFKLRGTKQEIASVTKQLVADNYGIEDGFRLDLIPIDSTTQAPANKKELNQGELVDALIDSDTNTSDETKTRLKDLWKGLI